MSTQKMIRRRALLMLNKATLLLQLLVLCLLASMGNAKTTSGDFRLSGVDTEYIMGSFAVGAGHMGKVAVELQSLQGGYDKFQFHVFRDDALKKLQDKSLLCQDKVKFALISQPVRFIASNKKNLATLVAKIDNTKEDKIHYFYFVLDECSLEMYMHDQSVPKLHYYLQAWDDRSHVSADETHLRGLHVVTLLVSGIVAILLGLAIMMQLHKSQSVHAAMFWVMAAATCDTASSFCEILHLSWYAQNGIGSYFLDAISAHLEALCDSLVALMLLSVASGWTLPSDVIAVHQHNATPIQKLLGGFRKPLEAVSAKNPTAILALSIFVVHAILAQWGRTYNDEFDSYHDYATLPGKLLMIFRMLLGVCLLVCIVQTKSRCPPSLSAFYTRLGLVGNVWFQSLPFVTWVCNMLVPYHARHKMVGIWGAVVQSTSILLLSWLVASNQQGSAYHKVSHMATKSSGSSNKDSIGSLTESLSARGETKSTWNFGGAKVRLD